MPERSIRVVPLGVDTATFHPGGTAVVPGRIVTTTSSDVPVKGLDQLIKAGALLRARRQRIEIVVVGALRAGSPADRAIAEHGLAELITFRAGLSGTELAELLRSAEVVCVPARYEGFSLPALEAMACGTPVVATAVGALPEVVGDGGLLVPAGDPAALARALGTVLTDQELRARLSAAAAGRAAGFTWRRTAHATVDCYRELLAGSTRRC